MHDHFPRTVACADPAVPACDTTRKVRFHERIAGKFTSLCHKLGKVAPEMGCGSAIAVRRKRVPPCFALSAGFLTNGSRSFRQNSADSAKERTGGWMQAEFNLDTVEQLFIKGGELLDQRPW